MTIVKLHKELTTIITFTGNGNDKRLITLLFHSPDTSQNMRKYKFGSDIILYYTHNWKSKYLRVFCICRASYCSV